MNKSSGILYYDLCIVGAGMIGTAAARHASLHRTLKICLIGPEEPKERVVFSGREVFGAHYDEGRITRGADVDPIWAQLAQSSIKNYKHLETESGVKFYHEVGSLLVGTNGGIFMKRIEENIVKTQGPFTNERFLDSNALKSKFPYFAFSKDDAGFYEPVKAGYLNPRKQVMAQTIVASNRGCDVIRDIVTRIIQADNEKSHFHRIVTEKGKLIYAKRVLLATGVFTEVHNLLPNSVRLKFKAMPQTVTLARVSVEDAHRLKDMPVLVYDGKGGDGWFGDYPKDDNGIIHFYLLPPIKYPDGNYYIKIGHGDSILEGPLKKSEIQKWHCGGGDTKLENQLFLLLKSVCKDTCFLSHNGDSCATMVTPSFHPYIDLITPTFGVAIGGNGRAGKSSDEIGRLAADMIVKSKWNGYISGKKFKINTTSSKL